MTTFDGLRIKFIFKRSELPRWREYHDAAKILLQRFQQTKEQEA